MRWTVLLIVAFAAVIAGALHFTHQPVLWNMTEPGMTVDEVRKALPRATAPAQAVRRADGLELKLVAPDVDHLERAFNAELYFDSAGLQSVVLRPTRLLTLEAARVEFEQLRHAASLRYGAERPMTPPAPLPSARWTSGPVTITLQLERQGSMTAVTMIYSTSPGARGS